MNYEKWISVFKGALIAGVGAAATVLVEFFSGADLGGFGPIIGAGLSVLVNLIRKWATPEEA